MDMSLTTVKIAAAFPLLIFLGSCSLLGREDLFKSGHYHLEVDNVDDYILEATSFQQDGRLIVEGRVTFRPNPNVPPSGDAEAQIFGPQADLLQTKIVPFEPRPQGYGHLVTRFQFIFDRMPPPESVIKLSYTLRSLHRVVDAP